MDFRIVWQMYKGSLTKNKMSEEIKEPFRNEIFQKLYIELSKKKQYAVLYQRYYLRNENTDFECVLFCSDVKDIQQSSLGRRHLSIILTRRILRLTYLRHYVNEVITND